MVVVKIRQPVVIPAVTTAVPVAAILVISLAPPQLPLGVIPTAQHLNKFRLKIFSNCLVYIMFCLIVDGMHNMHCILSMMVKMLYFSMHNLTRYVRMFYAFTHLEC